MLIMNDGIHYFLRVINIQRYLLKRFEMILVFYLRVFKLTEFLVDILIIEQIRILIIKGIKQVLHKAEMNLFSLISKSHNIPFSENSKEIPVFNQT